MRAERVYAYSDPLNDDFAGTNITTCRVGKEFRFMYWFSVLCLSCDITVVFLSLFDNSPY